MYGDHPADAFSGGSESGGDRPDRVVDTGRGREHTGHLPSCPSAAGDAFPSFDGRRRRSVSVRRVDEFSDAGASGWLFARIAWGDRATRYFAHRGVVGGAGRAGAGGLAREAELAVEEVHLDAEGDAEEQLYERFNPRRFRIDIRRAPLLRGYVGYDAAKQSWLLMLLRHHLTGDHTMLEVMQEEVEAYLRGEDAQLAAPYPFRNLVAQARLGVSSQEHEVFFRNMLADVDEPTAPFGLLDVRGDGRGIEQARAILDGTLAGRIRACARRVGVSAASVCHVAWACVLGRLTGRQDVVFGTVLFGRMQGGMGADRVMGLFINTLPVRILVGEQGSEECVRATHRLMADLLRHEHASLSLAQRCSGVPAPAPLFTTLLNYRHSSAVVPEEASKRAWEGIRWIRGEERTNYPLTLSVDDLGEDFALTAQTAPSVAAQRICMYMQTALESLVEALESAPATGVHEIEVLPASERHRVLYEWNDTKVEFASDRCVHQLFEEQAARTPHAVAVVYENEELSYGELNRQANRLAHYLRELGVRPDMRVALCVERSLEMIVGAAGCASLPAVPMPLIRAIAGREIAVHAGGCRNWRLF